MIKDIVMILSGVIGGCLFVMIRNKIVANVKAKINNTEISVEKFSLAKFLNGMFNLKSAKEWAKDIYSLFNLRKLIIVGVILGVIFGYGYYKGRMNTEVKFDLRGKEASIQLNEHFLKIEKDGTAKVVDKKGNILKTIRVKDIPGLQKALRPYGFKCEPIVVAGGSLGESGAGIEAGAGLSWFKYFKWNLDSFVTSKGLYPLGTSYQLTDNSGLGLGAGIGYKGDKRVILYYKWKF